MKKAVVLVLVALLVIGSVVAVYGKAQKEDLLLETTGVNYKLAVPSGIPSGFAILNNRTAKPAGKNNLIAVVSLKAGAAYGNQNFTVCLERYDALDNWLGESVLGTITTDANGNANANFKYMVGTGTQYLQIALAPNWIFTATRVSLTFK